MGLLLPLYMQKVLVLQLASKAVSELCEFRSRTNTNLYFANRSIHGRHWIWPPAASITGSPQWGRPAPQGNKVQ